MFEALVRLYDQLVQTGKCPGYGLTTKFVQFGLVLSKKGEVVDFIPFVDNMKFNKRKDGRSVTVPIPPLKGNNITPSFLYEDRSSYLFGVEYDKDKKEFKITEKSREVFKAEREYAERILNGVHSDAAEAVKGFFGTWNPEMFFQNQDITQYGDALPGAAVIIMYESGGEQLFTTQDEDVMSAWIAEWEKPEEGSKKMFSLVSGKLDWCAVLHGKVSLPGGQGSGCSVVSFNDVAVRSESLSGKGSRTLAENGLNAPMTKREAFAYVEALNAMMSMEEYRQILQDGTVIFQWTEAGTPAMLSELDSQQELLNELVSKIADGKPMRLKDNIFSPDIRFYVLVMKANGGRASVKMFYDNTYRELVKKYKQYADETSIGNFELADKYAIACSTLSDGEQQSKSGKTRKGRICFELQNAILYGTRYPDYVCSQIIERCMAENDAPRTAAAFCKAWLIRNKGENMEKNIDAENRSVGYLLGRLFAVLEKTQKDAKLVTGKVVDLTIKDKFFSAAATTPRSTFSLLLERNAVYSRALSKFGRGKALEEATAELVSRIEKFPARLTLEEKSEFMVGYYQQKEAFFADLKAKKKEESESGVTDAA